MVIAPILLPSNASPEAKEKEFLVRIGTLVHEMLHAYYELHVCPCDKGKCRGYRSNLATIGFTGHGFCWSLSARHLEDFARTELKLDLEFGRTAAWAKELAQNCKDEEVFPRPSDAAVMGLGALEAQNARELTKRAYRQRLGLEEETVAGVMHLLRGLSGGIVGKPNDV
jgi:hypothetical protein